MSDRSDIVTLIDGWDSLSGFARDAGVTYGAAKKMRKRQSIPVAYWPALLASERGREIALTSDTLVQLHTQGTRTDRQGSEEAEVAV